MAIGLTVNNVTYQYPTNGERGWGTQATGWANAITNGTLQKTGGLFSLTSDLDFGPTGGLKAVWFSSRTIPSSTEGVFRLGNNEKIGWRNAANTGNATIGLNNLDNYTISTPSTPDAVVIADNGALTFNGQITANGGINGTPDLILKSSGTEKMRINSSGNVLIGTTASSGVGLSRLEVASTAGSSQILASSTSASIGLYAGGAGVSYLQWTDGAALSFLTGPNNLATSTERMRIDSAGNVGIGAATLSGGASSKWLTLNGDDISGGLIFASNAVARSYIFQTLDGYTHFQGNSASSGFKWSAVNNERMRIDSAGNVGINTIPDAWGGGYKALSTPGASLMSLGTGGAQVTSYYMTGMYFDGNTYRGRVAGGSTMYVQSAGVHTWYGDPTTTVGGALTPTPRAALNTAGILTVGTTTVNDPGVTINGNNQTINVNNNNTTDTGVGLWLRSARVADVARQHIYCQANTNTVVFQVYGNGNVQNLNNSYGALSDVVLKENIVDATPKLEDLMKVKIRNFNLKSDPEKLKQIGVVAQELEEVFPGLIEETPELDGEREPTGKTLKGVKSSIFVPMLIKALQEQQVMIEDLRARVATLEA